MIQSFPEPNYDDWIDAWKFDTQTVDSITDDIFVKTGLYLARIEMEQIIDILIERGFIKKSENEFFVQQ
jgi:hypothetical protein